MGKTMRRAAAALLATCLLGAWLPGGIAIGASAEDSSPPPWFGGRIEMPGFALTLPDDWIAFDVDGDVPGQVASFVGWIREEWDQCETPSCETSLTRSLEGEAETVRLLAYHLADDGAPDPLHHADECRVHGPGSVGGQRIGEITGILHDVFEGSEDIDGVEVPRALRGGAPDYAFDFSALDHRIVGTVYVIGRTGEFAWIGCEGHTAPEDRWLPVAEAFEFLPGDEPSTSSSRPSAGSTSSRAVPDLQSMLPVWVAGRPLLSYSQRGLDYLREWSRASDEQLAALEEDPHAVAGLLPPGIELDDIEFANAGRADVDDPPHFATAFRINGIPARTLPLSLVVDDADAGAWTVTSFGNRVVQVGTEDMLDQHKRPGRPYVYDVGDVRFVVTTDDAAWAAEAIARLRPDAVVENATSFVSLPDAWQPGFSPTVADETKASAYESGILSAAHDGSKLEGRYVPTLEVHYTNVPLDTDMVSALDRWAREYPDEPWRGRTLRSLERVSLPSGEALRLELAGEAGDPAFTVTEIRYLIASPAGVFDLLFSAAESDLPALETTFDEMARSFLQAEPDPDGALARLGRGELTRTEFEMLAGGYTVVPEHTTSVVPVGAGGPVVLGGRVEVPALGFALVVPAGWHAIDLTHPDAILAMDAFDETTRNLLEGRLTPENPLQKGAFAIFGENLGGFTMMAAEELAENQSSDTFPLVAFAPWSGRGGPNECVVYGWDSEGLSLQDEAVVTAQALRESDYEVKLDSIRLPAGEASHIAGTGESWQFSIFVLARGDRFYYLECGHGERHDDQWQEIAESFEFLNVEP